MFISRLKSVEPAAPELLAPAGDYECIRAAIENGADAVYFGLDSGFNARARAKNFRVQDLPDLMRSLHRRGVRGYVTFNTLVFPDELKHAATAIEHIAEGGVDAVLVQDFGIARLIHEICPELEVHASTQMTLTSGECIEAARSLGISRVVLPRELSVREIRKVTSTTDIPVEVFVHGALCVAYSGQCLTSESLGGRSANRGQCAQACRLPYDLVVDGEDRDLGEVRYLLSPQDLAAYELIPELVDAGVCSLKIEGRLKTPEYVANIVQHYRQAIDETMVNHSVHMSPTQVREMELSFSRGFSPGWLRGCDHKMLVPGDNSAKRGVLLGTVREVRGHCVAIQLACPVALGDGVAFFGDRAEGEDSGGRVYDLMKRGRKIEDGRVSGGLVEMVVRGKNFDPDKLYIGQTVWKNDDPQLNKRLRQTFQTEDPIRQTPVDLNITAKVGQKLRVLATTASGCEVVVESEMPLEMARRHAVTEETLRAQFDRLGGTPFKLRALTSEIDGAPMVPHSVTGVLRRQIVESLIQAVESLPKRQINRSALDRCLASANPLSTTQPQGMGQESSTLWVMCRTMEQLEAVLEVGLDHVYLEFHDIREYSDAVKRIRDANATVFLSTLRIQKPGEFGLTKKLLRHEPDGLLVRNLSALALCKKEGLPAVSDFSLNAANELSIDWLHEKGAIRATVSYDLNRDQLEDLIRAARCEVLESVIHQHMPMFHMEHCVFCAVISPGTDKTNCGRPCDRHQVLLKDRIGKPHPLQADIGCRNTLFNATPQSAAEVVPEMLRAGVRHFRAELLEDSASQTKRIVQLYRRLLQGDVAPRDVLRDLQASNRVGVTRGTLEERRNPLAII